MLAPYVQAGSLSCPICRTRSTRPLSVQWWPARGQHKCWWQILCTCFPMHAENRRRRMQQKMYQDQVQCWEPPGWWQWEEEEPATLFWRLPASPQPRGFLLPIRPPLATCRRVRSPLWTWSSPGRNGPNAWERWRPQTKEPLFFLFLFFLFCAVGRVFEMYRYPAKCINSGDWDGVYPGLTEISEFIDFPSFLGFALARPQKRGGEKLPTLHLTLPWLPSFPSHKRGL